MGVVAPLEPPSQRQGAHLAGVVVLASHVQDSLQVG